jgi:ribonucleotide monophosphatase NagD (HAD superfamily)
MAAMVTERFGRRGVMVGDRPSTDGALAALLKWPFALVLSGVTGRVAPPGGETVPEPPPPIVGDDLASIVPALRNAVAAIGDA